MAVRTQILSAAVMVFVLAAAAAAQVRDPLTPAEADQVRATAGQLNKRIPLLVQFAQERITHFENVRRTPVATPGRSAQLYTLLRQYREILPELDDAVDDLASSPGQPGGPKYNIPKVLDQTIAAQRQLLSQLKQIQKASSAEDLATYHFQLQDCLDATRDSLQNAEQDRADAGKKPAPPSA